MNEWANQWMNEWINEWMNEYPIAVWIINIVILISFKLLLILYSNYSNSTSITSNLVPVLIIVTVLATSKY